MLVFIFIVLLLVAFIAVIVNGNRKNSKRANEKIVQCGKSGAVKSNARRRVTACTKNFDVKGLRFREIEEIRAAKLLTKGDTLILVKEPDNPVDPNAVKVCTINGTHIGYVPNNLSAFVFDRIDHIQSCKVKKVSEHEIPFIDAELEISQDKKSQPSFIQEEHQVSPKDELRKITGFDEKRKEHTKYGTAVAAVQGIYELPDDSIIRAKNLVQGERLTGKKVEPTKYCKNRIDLFTEDGVCVGFISDQYKSDIYRNFDKIKDIYVEMPMSETDYEHFAIRMIVPFEFERSFEPFSAIREIDEPESEIQEADWIKRTDTMKALEIALPLAEKEKGIDAKFLCCQCYRLLKDYESEEAMIHRIINHVKTIDRNFVSPNMYQNMVAQIPTIQKRLATVQTRLANKKKK